MGRIPGIPLYTTNETNYSQIRPLLALAGAIPYIDEAINQGRTVVVPQSTIQLNQWQGVGWIVLNPATGSAGYYILGSLAHPSATNVTTAGGSGTEPVEPEAFKNMSPQLAKWLQFLAIAQYSAGFIAAGADKLLAGLGAIEALGLAAAMPQIATGLALMAIGGGIIYLSYAAIYGYLNRKCWFALKQTAERLA